MLRWILKKILKGSSIHESIKQSLIFCFTKICLKKYFTSVGKPLYDWTVFEQSNECNFLFKIINESRIHDSDFKSSDHYFYNVSRLKPLWS